MQAHAPRTDLGQSRDDLLRGDRWARRQPERVSAAMTDRPQSEAEAIVRGRCVQIVHRAPLSEITPIG